MYFQYGDTEINYLKRKDKKLALAIEQIGHIERKLDMKLTDEERVNDLDII